MSEIKEEVVIEKAIDSKDVLAKSLGAIKCIEVNDKRLYLKMPNRHAIGVAYSQLKINAVQAYEGVARASAVREVSDMSILENDIEFLSIMSELAEFLGEIELKKSHSRSL